MMHSPYVLSQLRSYNSRKACVLSPKRVLERFFEHGLALLLRLAAQSTKFLR